MPRIDLCPDRLVDAALADGAYGTLRSFAEGETFKLPITVTDAGTGAAVDVTTWTFTARFGSDPAQMTGLHLATFTLDSTGAANGEVILVLDATKTTAVYAGFTPTQQQPDVDDNPPEYEVYVTNAAGEVERPQWGRLWRTRDQLRLPAGP